jgi:hypothetical protein
VCREKENPEHIAAAKYLRQEKTKVRQEAAILRNLYQVGDQREYPTSVTIGRGQGEASRTRKQCSGSGIRMNVQDYIFESLETIF